MVRVFIDLSFSCGGNAVPVEVAKTALQNFMARDEHYAIVPAPDPANHKIVGIVQNAGIDNAYRPYADIQLLPDEDGDAIMALMQCHCPFLCCIDGNYTHNNAGTATEIAISAVSLVPKPQVQS